MSVPHIIVRGIKALEPGGQMSAQHVDARPNALTVHFNDDEIATLAGDDEHYAIRNGILMDFHREGLPVYAEVDPQSRVIRELRIPLQGNIGFLNRDSSGYVRFTLDSSAKPFDLEAHHPKTRDYLRVLRDAQLDGVPVRLTETDDGAEIVDIRRTESEEGVVQHSILPDSVLPDPGRPVSKEQADELFKRLASRSCKIGDPPGSCIPFRYPENGCHARAHEMCILLIRAGEQPLKVWNCCQDRRHRLIVETPNAPGGRVSWVFHVSAALEVQVPGGKPETQVLDPSLFDRPVSALEWKKKQGDPDSCLMYTSPAPYLPPAPAHVQFDPDGKKTRRDLVRYGSLLAQRDLYAGPPPS